MVIAGHCSAGTGPCSSVRRLGSTSTTTPWPVHGGDAAASGRAAAADGGLPRANTPCRLASESTRNCPEATTCWPATSPGGARRGLVDLLADLDFHRAVAPAGCRDTTPVCRSRSRLRPAPRASRVGPRRLTWANMPALARPPGSAVRCARAACVSRVASGSTAPRAPSTPRRARREAGLDRLAGRRTRPALRAGRSSHTVPRPLMRASVMPGASVMPWRTISSVMTPPVGALMVYSGTAWPDTIDALDQLPACPAALAAHARLQ